MSGSRGWQATLADLGGTRLDLGGESADRFARRAREADARDAAIEDELARRDARQPIDRLLGREMRRIPVVVVQHEARFLGERAVLLGGR